MKKYYLKNILDHDIETQYAGETHTLPAEKITDFDDEVIFNHMRAYLVTAILNRRNMWHFEENRKLVRDEVTTKL